MCENENILKCKWSCMLPKSFVLCMRRFMKYLLLLYMILKKSKEMYIFEKSKSKIVSKLIKENKI